MSDLETAKRILAGDVGAAEGFVREHYSSVLRFLRHLTRRVDDAEDLTLQSLLKAKEGLGSFRGDSSLRTWVHSVAFREYTKWKRKQRFTLSLRPHFSYEEYRYALVGLAEDLLSSLHKLPAPQREVFLLHEIEQFSLEEVAAMVNIPIGTVKSRLFHARRKLRELLSIQEEETINGTTIYEWP